MQEKKLKHLEFIQQAVNRMASNLFLLNGWTVTLIAALFALAAKDSKDVYFLIAYFPPLVFWVLDGYLLSQERRFRALYDHVRKLDENQIEFSMDTQPFSHGYRHSWPGSMFSRTLVIYYGSLIAVMLGVIPWSEFTLPTAAHSCALVARPHAAARRLRPVRAPTNPERPRRRSCTAQPSTHAHSFSATAGTFGAFPAGASLTHRPGRVAYATYASNAQTLYGRTVACPASRVSDQRPERARAAALDLLALRLR